MEHINNLLDNIKNIIEETDKKLNNLDDTKKKRSEEIKRLKKEVKKSDNEKLAFKQKRDNKIKNFLGDLLIAQLKEEKSEEEDFIFMTDLRKLFKSYNISIKDIKESKKTKEMKENLESLEEQEEMEDDEDEIFNHIKN